MYPPNAQIFIPYLSGFSFKNILNPHRPWNVTNCSSTVILIPGLYEERNFDTIISKTFRIGANLSFTFRSSRLSNRRHRRRLVNLLRLIALLRRCSVYHLFTPKFRYAKFLFLRTPISSRPNKQCIPFSSVLCHSSICSMPWKFVQSTIFLTTSSVKIF